MKSFIKFMPTQYQMNPLLIHRCYGKRISNSSLMQWRVNLKTTYLQTLESYGAQRLTTWHKSNNGYLVIQMQTLSRRNTKQHKTWLCAHGGQQTWGQDHWLTYAHVVMWASIQLLLIIAKIHGLESKSIDLVLAFPQADLDVPVCMELPVGINPNDISDEN